MAELGKTLIVFGLVLTLVGLALWSFGGLSIIGRLPGDLYIRRGNFTFYFPLATCILLSIVFSLILMLLRR
jgi:hypothetical protein